MSNNLRDEINETLEQLKVFSRKLANTVDILEKTANAPAATNNSAMDLISDLKKHQWVEKTKFSTALTGVHKSLFRDANIKLANRIATEREALAHRNPIKISKKKIED